jgi:CRP/FNR family transcriptional regulator, cyclic AMP receptor protein
MHTLAAILAAHPFFKGFDPTHIQFIARCARNVRYDAGNYIFHEGEPATHFYLIRQGLVALETMAARHQPVTIETIETEEVLGWSWLFPPYRWHFSALVIEPVRAISLDGICLREKSEEDHELGYQLTKRVAQIMLERLQATRLQLLDIYYVPAGGG